MDIIQLETFTSLFGIFEFPKFIEYQSIDKIRKNEKFISQGVFAETFVVSMPEIEYSRIEGIISKKNKENTYVLKALKETFYNIKDQKVRERFLTILLEFKHQGMINHPNIVKCLGYSFNLVDGHIKNTLAVLEHGDTDLQKFLLESETNRPLSLQEKFQISLGIARGLQALHKFKPKPIVHMDLQPSNIIIFQRILAKISDFGASRQLDPKETSTYSFLMRTVYYLAPQVELNNWIVRKESDVFSLGLIFMEIFYSIKSSKREKGLFPYIDAERNQFLQNIQQPDLQLIPKLIDRMVSTQYKDRPVIDEIVFELERLGYLLFTSSSILNNDKTNFQLIKDVVEQYQPNNVAFSCFYSLQILLILERLTH